MTPELDLLDQLQGDDLPLAVAVVIFGSAERARQGIRCLMADGMVQLLDSASAPIALWRWDELCRLGQSAWEQEIDNLNVRLTTRGAKFIGG